MSDDEFTVRGGIAYIDRDVYRDARSFGPKLQTNHYATWPFARLRVWQDQLAVTSLFGEFVSTRASLVSISRFGRVPLLDSGLKIVERGFHDAVIFIPLRTGKVIDELHVAAGRSGRAGLVSFTRDRPSKPCLRRKWRAPAKVCG